MIKNNILHFFEDEYTTMHELTCAVLRIDTLHPIISGNKLFKLKYYIKEAVDKNKKGILTLGGYYSNHLVATAYAAEEAGLISIGIVRGEKPTNLSPTLIECINYNMEIIFYNRNKFDSINVEELQALYPEYIVIPQGGYGKNGMLGAKDILQIKGTEEFDHIVAACGTGTMGAGLISAAADHQKIVLISVLKHNFSVLEEIRDLLHPSEKNYSSFDLLFDFHLGGYARTSQQLFDAMNYFYSKHQIPTDFVYTGKMVYGFYELAASGFFPKKSKILLIHSGGLQGNRSLTNNQLIYC